jgi:hypothetical protein
MSGRSPYHPKQRYVRCWWCRQVVPATARRGRDATVVRVRRHDANGEACSGSYDAHEDSYEEREDVP